jgi:hypothetical protein
MPPNVSGNGTRLRSWLPGAGLALLAAAVLLAAPAAALGWGDRAHGLIIDEAVARLPEPLRGLFAGEADLKRLREAVLAPDIRRKKETQPAEWEEEHPKHFFDIDLVTQEAYPFKNFPRERAAAEKEFGKDVFKKAGTAPWAAQDALQALADALTAGRTDEIFTQAGDLAHYAADLHQPFHVSKNYDGRMTGNGGIHKALEIGLVNHFADFYAAEVRKNRCDPPYAADPVDRLFDWLIEAWSRQKPILEAETIARKKADYNPSKALADLDNYTSDAAKTYYAAFRSELEARGSPEANAMRDAAAHSAELLYTAWVRAGKPVTLTPAPARPEEAPATPYWLIGLAIGLFILLFWPRRRPA